MAGWSIATATYFAFRDDLLKGLIARQAEQQYAYEDRIAELRARIDRTTSRQLLDQEQFEQKLDDLMRRQSTLESRAAALGGDRRSCHDRRNQAGGECRRLRFTYVRRKHATAARRSSLTAHRPRAGPARMPTSAPSFRASKRRSIASSGARRLRLAQLQERYEGKARRLRGVLADLGLKLDGPAPAGSGGPFVPIKLPGEGNSFERAVARVNIARTQAEHLSRTLRAGAGAQDR